MPISSLRFGRISHALFCVFTLLCSLVLLSACTARTSGSSSMGVILTSDSDVSENKIVAEEEVINLDVPPATATEPLSREEEKVLMTQVNIDIEMSDADKRIVESYVKFYTGRARPTLERYLKRAAMYLPDAQKVFRENGLPEELVYLAFVESGFNPNAYSRAGAAGIWQFMRGTGKQYGLTIDWWQDERRDPHKSVEAACAFLKSLHAEFGDWYLAIAAYNAGGGKIGRAMKKTGAESFFELAKNNKKARLAKETRNYVPKFIAFVKIMRNLEALGFEEIDTNPRNDMRPITVQGGTDLLALTQHLNMKWSEFKLYNSAYLRYVSPPNKETTAYISRDAHAKAVAYLASPKSRPYEGWISYSVRSGDSWYRIAKKYGIPIAVLKTVNGTKSNLLKPKQRLMIPRSVAGQGTLAAQSKSARIAQEKGNYIVRSGDTLSGIGKEFGISVSTLKAANGLRSSRLALGQKLYIPEQQALAQQTKSRQKARASLVATTYKVRRGDSLWSIAQKFHTSHSNIMRWNGLSKNTVIRPGDSLKLFVN